MRRVRAMQILVLGVAALFALMAVRCSSEETAPQAKPEAKVSPETKERNPKWARPIERPGLPNLHQVSDALYRGAQPEPQGFAELHELGVKTVVNLRGFHSDRDEIRESGLPEGAIDYVHIRMHAWSAEDEDIVAFLKVMADEQNHPVFVHCQHGADRTGTMSAIYRIAFEGWSNEDALKEMLYGGFGFHSVWGNLVEYLSKVDIVRLKSEAGIAK